MDDLPELEDLASKYTDNPLPTKFVSAAIIQQYDDVKAFGVLRSHFEGLFYVEGSTREIVESLKMLMNQAILDARKCEGVDSIYVYAQNEEFAKILEKHFGFRRASGVPMILDL